MQSGYGVLYAPFLRIRGILFLECLPLDQHVITEVFSGVKVFGSRRFPVQAFPAENVAHVHRNEDLKHPDPFRSWIKIRLTLDRHENDPLQSPLSTTNVEIFRGSWASLFDSLRPLQNYPNVFIPELFSDSYVTALVILLQGVHTADGTA